MVLGYWFPLIIGEERVLKNKSDIRSGNRRVWEERARTPGLYLI